MDEGREDEGCTGIDLITFVGWWHPSFSCECQLASPNNPRIAQPAEPAAPQLCTLQTVQTTHKSFQQTLTLLLSLEPSGAGVEASDVTLGSAGGGHMQQTFCDPFNGFVFSTRLYVQALHKPAFVSNM